MDIERFEVAPGTTPALDDIPTRGDDWVDGDPGHAKKRTKKANKELRRRIAALQQQLHASEAARVLVVLQGMDTSGKDSTTRRVFGEGSPIGIRVVGFGKPSPTELAHDYLWRVHAATPADGQIVVFNRSHYEDVLAVRVQGLVGEARWRRRYEHIVEFERLLVDEGTLVLKFFLHISPDEQRERLQDRLDDPEKHWKFDPRDLTARERWDDYRVAYEEALARTSSEHAPWYVVPADQKWFRDHVVASVVVDALEGLQMRWPVPDGLDGVTLD